MQQLSQRLAAFSAALGSGDVPADVLDKARACRRHALRIGLPCHATPYAAFARQTLGASAATGGATLLFDGRKVDIEGDASLDSLGCRLVILDSTGVAQRVEVTPKAEDFSWDRATVASHVRRATAEAAITGEACARPENWVDSLPRAIVADLLPVFSTASLRQA
jgi:hypothetical protein